MENKNPSINEVSITKVSLKDSDDNMKTFADSTMNELLSWYGYDARQGVNTRNCRSFSGSNDSEADSIKFTEGCGWCGKITDENSSVTSGSTNFCSELCFSQSRRATFKKNKTCDWCRHAKTTLSSEEFQESAAQLQFCSEKCLNQYKMHIFCRETQAHLELHPHLHGSDSTSTNLITPDLWLRSATSPKPRQSSPTPVFPHRSSYKSKTSEQLPVINVVSGNNLFAADTKRNRTKSSRRMRRAYPSTITSNVVESSDIPQDLRVRQSSPIPVQTCTKTMPKLEHVDNHGTESKIDNPFNDQHINFSCNGQLENTSSNLTPEQVRTILGNYLPPPTTFVPYPVIMPLPIPIPVPIPIPKMLKTNNNKDLIELKDAVTQTETIPSTDNRVEVEADVDDTTPLNSRRLLRKRKQVVVKFKASNKNKKHSTSSQ